MIPDRHELVGIDPVLRPSAVVGVQGDGHVVIPVQRDDDHLAVLGAYPTESGVGSVLVGGRGAGEAVREVWLVVHRPDDHA